VINIYWEPCSLNHFLSTNIYSCIIWFDIQNNHMTFTQVIVLLNLGKNNYFGKLGNLDLGLWLTGNFNNLRNIRAWALKILSGRDEEPTMKVFKKNLWVDLARISPRSQGLFIQHVLTKHRWHASYTELQEEGKTDSPALKSLQSNEKHM
jgi:hypothetical protein